MRDNLFERVKSASTPHIETLCRDWLPDGRRVGGEWVARNPCRNDRRAGSFKINLRNGRWADFAIGESGGDVISLHAYLRGCSQIEAARSIADRLGVSQ